MKFINFTVVKFSFFLIFGILASHFFPISTLSLPILLALFGAVVLLWFWTKNKVFQTVYFGIATYLCFFAVGYFSYQIRLPKFQPQHYSHFISENNPRFVQLKITENLKPNNYYQKYVATAHHIDGMPVSGKILLNISKDSTAETLLPDEVVLVYGTISEIPPPLNPHQFDYSKYLKTIGIYGEMRIPAQNILTAVQGTRTLKGTAENLRGTIVQKLTATNLETQERGILQALIL
ncbi:MAG TPA: ComEC/Rec2 family competence protein, partial [Flavobacteriaceae bacterium]|nr:ComEC/Rec2 family competence protein [Flavobacteriaceae bacterium]